MKIKDCVLIEAFHCHENDSVVEVAKKLRGITLRHIFVVNDKEYPVGIISIVDINNRVVALGKDASKMKAKEIMSKPVIVSDFDDDAEKLSEKLLETKYVMAPVVKNGKMAGIVTINQLWKFKA